MAEKEHTSKNVWIVVIIVILALAIISTAMINVTVLDVQALENITLRINLT